MSQLKALSTARNALVPKVVHVLNLRVVTGE